MRSRSLLSLMLAYGRHWTSIAYGFFTRLLSLIMNTIMCVAGVRFLRYRSLKNCLSLGLRSVNSLGMFSDETAFTKEPCGKLASLMMFAIMHYYYCRNYNHFKLHAYSPCTINEISCRSVPLTFSNCIRITCTVSGSICPRVSDS